MNKHPFYNKINNTPILAKTPIFRVITGAGEGMHHWGSTGRLPVLYIPSMKAISTKTMRMPITADLIVSLQLFSVIMSYSSAVSSIGKSSPLIGDSAVLVRLSGIPHISPPWSLTHTMQVQFPPRYEGRFWKDSERTFWNESPSILSFCLVVGLRTWCKGRGD